MPSKENINAAYSTMLNFISNERGDVPEETKEWLLKFLTAENFEKTAELLTEVNHAINRHVLHIYPVANSTNITIRYLTHTNYIYICGLHTLKQVSVSLDGFLPWYFTDRVVTCEDCGKTLPAGELVDNLYCADCATDNGYIHCAHCDAFISESDSSISDDGDYYCESCYDDIFSECGHCGREIRRDDCSYSDYHEIYVCDECLRDGYYRSCDNCGNLVCQDYIVYDEYSDSYLCENCYDSRPRTIQGYGHTDGVNFYTTSTVYHLNSLKNLSVEENLFFGTELEIDDGTCRQDCAKEMLDKYPEFIECKEDGSLDGGFEIVTQPAALEYYNDGNYLDDVTRIARDYDFTSHDNATCGFHVHASRAGLGVCDYDQDYTIAKIVILLYKYWDSHIVRFSRRSGGQLDRWARKPQADRSDYDDLKNYSDDATAKIIDKNQCGRYFALNLTCRKTIEFRFFRGSLVPETLRAAIQFCNNLCVLARENDTEKVLSLTWEDIINYGNFTDLKAYNDKRKHLYNENYIVL